MSLHRNNSCANYAASVSPDELCRAALVSPALRSVIQSLSDTIWILDSEEMSEHISKGTLLSLSAEPIRHHPAHAYMSTSALELWSLHILCLRQKQELCCLIICSLKTDWFAQWTSALLIHFKTTAHKSQIKMPAAIFLSPNNDGVNLVILMSYLLTFSLKTDLTWYEKTQNSSCGLKLKTLWDFNLTCQRFAQSKDLIIRDRNTYGCILWAA